MATWKWSVAVAVPVALLAATAIAAPKKGAQKSGLVSRGEYLVTIGGCNDCHTPLKMGPEGPAPDTTRMLSGHPQELVIEATPKPPDGPWMLVGAPTLTAWAGPWGTSFSSNLTPDDETGIGKWTEQNFVEAMRKGKHMGRGRPILPPMPWQGVGKMTDDDLKATFAYLRSLPPIKNRVPDPLPPAGGTGSGDR
jgi:mono/diheme cytochrome c family protein